MSSVQLGTRLEYRYVRLSYLYPMNLLSPRHVVQHGDSTHPDMSVMGPECSINIHIYHMAFKNSLFWLVDKRSVKTNIRTVVRIFRIWTGVPDIYIYIYGGFHLTTYYSNNSIDTTNHRNLIFKSLQECKHFMWHTCRKSLRYTDHCLPCITSTNKYRAPEHAFTDEKLPHRSHDEYAKRPPKER
jgi:hypothetical protein